MSLDSSLVGKDGSEFVWISEVTPKRVKLIDELLYATTYAVSVTATGVLIGSTVANLSGERINDLISGLWVIAQPVIVLSVLAGATFGYFNFNYSRKCEQEQLLGEAS